MNTFRLIQSYRMTSNPLTAEQYAILLPERDAMYSVVHTPELDIKNPDFGWWKLMQPVYSQLFGGPYPSMGCKACRIDTLRRLWFKVQEYEQTQAKHAG